VAHQVAILEAGRVVLQGTAKELEEHADVREVYLGLGGAEAASPRGWRLYRKRRRW
jgi:branched-chain amino acid transport system ATP-binding protein